ncbi:MAG: HTH-type transcriptional regulator CysB [Candidatus Polarisedimenticolaceae bacterium]|nr:HTH-type transcriptional regulator CysB [Candidatus Polarisedimenticolaceae bacterium]
MKLQQLRYILEVARHDLNISATAEALFTSQPGISKQIRLLEDELGVEIFERRGKQLTRVTSAGKRILQHARQILGEVNNIRMTGQEYSNPNHGNLSIGTTHTQARYLLPNTTKTFLQRHPGVRLHMHQGTPIQIAKKAVDAEVDCCIATEGMEQFEELIMLPCYRWNRCIVTPLNHPLCKLKELTLEAIGQHPIVTYVSGYTGSSQIDLAFQQKGVVPNIVFTAADADVIKTYVRLGLGVGIIARMAVEKTNDADLVALDASHLFNFSTTKIGLRRGTYIREFLYDFIEMFAPHLTREMVELAMQCKNQSEVDQLFSQIDLPVY